jgi:ABC-type cobalamin/Fe3+-siderophores transport system ATPase subunit
MTIGELYHEAIIENEPSLLMLIDFLVKEKRVLTMDEPAAKLDYYLQDRFANKMNQYLREYEPKWKGGRATI